MKKAQIDTNGNPIAFYDTEIHGGNIPTDAVEISEADWKAHINGQRKVYQNGTWVDYQPTPEEIAAKQQAELKSRVDAYANAAQQRINAELSARDYDDESQLATYATTQNQYTEEAQALQAWIVNDVWPAWETKTADPTTLDPAGAEQWANTLPAPQV